MMALVQKPKHVASYCKQKGIYLPMNLYRLCRNVLLVHLSFCHRLSQMWRKEQLLFSSELKPHLFYGATIYLNRVVTWQRSLSTSSRLVYCLQLGWLTLPPTNALPQWIVLLTNCSWIWEIPQSWEPGLMC